MVPKQSVNIMTNSPPAVHDLRRRWKPHELRLHELDPEHPTPIRFHRACSWLNEADQLDPENQVDTVLLFQWIALNALYGQWDEERQEPYADGASWQAFLQRILNLDRSGHVVAVLQEHKRLVLTILENEYLNGHFWQDPGEQAKGQARRGRYYAQGWYVEKRWATILDQLVQRIYLLRCQLVHGAATHGSQLNRTVLQHCTIMMRRLLPAVLLVWIDHGANEDWGAMCYPPLGANVRRLVK